MEMGSICCEVGIEYLCDCFQEDLDALQGMKCQAPHKCQWRGPTYHNALVCAVQLTSNIRSMDQIQVVLSSVISSHD